MNVERFLDIRPAPLAVLERALLHPDRPRFHVRAPSTGSGRTAWKVVTWGDFARDLCAATAFLKRCGVVAGDRVAIFSPNSVEWAAAALAIQAAGAMMVPIYPASTREQAGHILRHSGASLAFVHADLLPRVSDVDIGDLPDLEMFVVFGQADPSYMTWLDAVSSPRDPRLDLQALADELHAADLDRPALMLYTSGTSGPPKGVPLTHNNVGANARDWLTLNAPLLDEHAVDLLWLPLSHIFGFGELCLGNTLGFESYLATPKDALPLLPEVAPTVFMSVPAYWEKLAQPALAETDPSRRKAKLAAATGGKLKFCLSGGAGLSVETKSLFHECGALIIEGYGLTETSPTLALNRPDAFRFDSVGKPLPSVDIELADDGEILARGPNVFAGYYKDPQATAAAFTDDGWFKTGDIGRFTDDGFLQIVDRKKDILVTAGGKNIPPANIELRFRDDAIIENLVVYGDGKKYLVAGVWVDRAQASQILGPSASAQAIHDHVAARIEAVNRELASCETIKRFCILDEPLTVESGLVTASLKIRRKLIYRAFEEKLEALYHQAHP